MTFSNGTSEKRHNQPVTALINARLVDPESGTDELGGLVITDDKISDLGPHLRRNSPEGAEIIDCAGHMVCPGLVDMQVYTGEPGSEHKETLASASQAAAAGGVTTIVCMPNTDPVIDDVALVDFIQRRARDTAIVRVATMAALCKNLGNEQMAEIGLLKEAGALAFTNGKKSLTNAQVMRRALLYARDFDALIVHHTEDENLSADGVMNEGEVSSRLGLPGIPKEAETIMLERDIRLVALTKCRYHAAQISCADSLSIIKHAKKRELPVTCGVSINHITLNENDIGSYRTFFKLRPPLRDEEDRVALVHALNDGLIDVITSNHDPQDVDMKRHPFAEAADGAIGLETLLPAALRLYHDKSIALPKLLRAMTVNPANILSLPTGRLAKGAPADLIIVDLDIPWVLDPDQLCSKSKNTPFDESRLQGRVLQTFVAGQCVYTHSGS